MESQNAFARKVHQWRMICWIVIGVSLVAMAWGLRSIIAHGGVKGMDLAAGYAVAFGFCALMVAVIILFCLWSQSRSYGRITRSDHPVLLRWQCTDDEANRFIASEVIRLQISRRAPLYLALILIAVGVWIAYIQRENFEWGAFFIGYAILSGVIVFCYLFWRATNAVELRAAKTRATSEIIIDAEGLVAGTDVFKWRSFNWGLEAATYENGQPDVLNLVFLAGTLPGSATVGTLRTAAYVAGAASSPGGQTQQRTTVRIPVTASKAAEMRQLLSTSISQHLLIPSIIP
jgi:hypothetical protein